MWDSVISKDDCERIIDTYKDKNLTEAKIVVEDYKKTPTEISGSVTHIHIDSPLLGEENDK